MEVSGMDKKVSNSQQRLLELMDYYNMNQSELCRRTGLQKSALSNYLKGIREPRQDKISLIADEFNINPAWLMGYDVPMFLDRPEVIAWKNHDSDSLDNDTVDVISEAERLLLFKIRRTFSSEELKDPMFIEQLSNILELAKRSGTDRLLALLDFANRTVS